MDTPYYVVRTNVFGAEYSLRRSGDGIICTFTDMLMAYRIVEALNREESAGRRAEGQDTFKA